MFAKAGGRGYNHYLGSYIRHLPVLIKSEARELALLLIKGDKVAYDRLFFGMLKLVFQLAASYNYHNRDDLFSQAILGLMEALDKYPAAAEKYEAELKLPEGVQGPVKEQEHNIRSYVAQYVRQVIRDFIYDNKGVPVPRQSATRGVKIPGVVTEISEHMSTIDEHQEVLECSGLLDAICADDVDKKILKLRLAEYTDTQISQMLGYSPSFVVKRRAKIGARLLERRKHEDAEISQPDQHLKVCRKPGGVLSSIPRRNKPAS